MTTSRLEVTMSKVHPTVVRVIDVPAGVLLPELHDLLQAAIGWTDSHLHQFVAGDISYWMPDLDGSDDERDESAVALRALPDRFIYLYDFGDGWEHEVVAIGPGGDWPGVIAGEGACPPRMSAGRMATPSSVGRWLTPTSLSTKSSGPGREAGTTASTWTPPTCSSAKTVGTVPAPVRLVLRLAADGVKLTPGGRLPRAFVREVQKLYPNWSLSERPASMEEDLLPLAALHDRLRHVGLLRLRKGTLCPTRAAVNDLEVIRRLKSWGSALATASCTSSSATPSPTSSSTALPTRRAGRPASTPAWRPLGHQPRSSAGCGSGPSGFVRTAVHTGGTRPHSVPHGNLDRGSVRALVVAAGDGAGPHMVDMAHVVVKSRRQRAMRSPNSRSTFATGPSTCGRCFGRRMAENQQNRPRRNSH
jgi:hypothetical protein